jgi:hypothetical protein
MSLLSVNQHVAGKRLVRRGDADEVPKCGIAVAAGVEAESELVEIGLEMLGVEAMVGAQGPCFELRKDTADPQCVHHMRDMAVVADGRSTTIYETFVSLDRDARCQISGKESVQALR